MKIRFLTIALLLCTTTALFADGPVKRTIVVKDGKVVSSTEDGLDFSFDSHPFGGKRAYLGVSLVDLTDELREHYGAPKDAGLLVASVEDDSPADKAGIRVGDIIVSIDGKDVESSGDLRRGLREKKEGDTVRVEVLRGRARQTLVATVVEREGLRVFAPGDFEGLRRFDGPEWKGRVEAIGDCATCRAASRNWNRASRIWRRSCRSKTQSPLPTAASSPRGEGWVRGGSRDESIYTCWRESHDRIGIAFREPHLRGPAGRLARLRRGGAGAGMEGRAPARRQRPRSDEDGRLVQRYRSGRARHRRHAGHRRSARSARAAHARLRVRRRHWRACSAATIMVTVPINKELEGATGRPTIRATARSRW